MLSNAELGAQIKEHQKKISESLSKFELNIIERQVEPAKEQIYMGISMSLLYIRVLISGSKLADCIEQLIELNQQITLEINDSDGSDAISKKGVELEQKLIEIAEELEEIEEKNGFVEESDIQRV